MECSMSPIFIYIAGKTNGLIKQTAEMMPDVEIKWRARLYWVVKEHWQDADDRITIETGEKRL